MSTPQTFNAKIGEAHEQAQAKASELIKSTKDGAIAAQDKVCNLSQSAIESGQQGQKNATGFIQQTSTNVTNLATGAVDSVKNTFGMNDKPVAAPVQKDQENAPGFIQQAGAAANCAVDSVKNTLGMTDKAVATETVEKSPQNAPGFLHQTGVGVMNAANSAVDTVKNTLGMNDQKK